MRYNTIYSCIYDFVPRDRAGDLLALKLGYNPRLTLIIFLPMNSLLMIIRVYVCVNACFRHVRVSLDPYRTAVPFRRQTTWNLSGLFPKWDCRPNSINRLRTDPPFAPKFRKNGSYEWLIRSIVITLRGGIVSRTYVRYTQKPVPGMFRYFYQEHLVRFDSFTNNIWSYLLRSPVILMAVR